MSQFEAQCYRSGSSEQFNGLFSFSIDGDVAVVFDGQTLTAKVSEVNIEVPVGQLPYQVRFPDGTLVKLSYSKALAAAFRQCGHQSRLGFTERSWRAVFVSLLLVMLSGVLGYIYGVPALTSVIANALPNSVAEQVGERTLTELDKSWLEASTLSTEEQARITARFDHLVSQLPDMPLTPRLVFRRDNDLVNAFALSDGTVILLDGLVTVAPSDQALDSVLLHELAHVYHKDVMHSLVRASLNGVIVAMITGEASGVLDSLLGVGVFVSSQGYSRHVEQIADDFAAENMLAIHGSVEPMKAMFEVLGQDHAMPELLKWLNSHPDMDARIKAIDSAALKVGKDGQ
ncbi:M48 family metallopeptidase [Thaumasiovibrio subtropicus]|uniref:M48 family metallopeptidase n=1 Tax=Thaumasiovibrio subtropicus TaxID=1891207 RepID=UPI000B351A1F|nr:M48 family metallopeptidase [Thaumasiovibrio subtropicus]